MLRCQTVNDGLENLTATHFQALPTGQPEGSTGLVVGDADGRLVVRRYGLDQIDGTAEPDPVEDSDVPGRAGGVPVRVFRKPKGQFEVSRDPGLTSSGHFAKPSPQVS